MIDDLKALIERETKLIEERQRKLNSDKSRLDNYIRDIETITKYYTIIDKALMPLNN
jgi:hypothetical protein